MDAARKTFEPHENDTDMMPRRDFADPAPHWRPRPPLESTTYSIVPEPPTSEPPRARSSTPSEERDARDARESEALSPTQGREIDAMYASLDSLADHDVLAVAADAGLEELARAHERAVAAFHPSRFARKRLGARGKKLAAIVARMDEAYAALCAQARSPQKT